MSHHRSTPRWAGALLLALAPAPIAALQLSPDPGAAAFAALRAGVTPDPPDAGARKAYEVALARTGFFLEEETGATPDPLLARAGEVIDPPEARLLFEAEIEPASEEIDYLALLERPEPEPHGVSAPAPAAVRTVPEASQAWHLVAGLSGLGALLRLGRRSAAVRPPPPQRAACPD